MKNPNSLQHSKSAAITAFETNETYFSMMRDWHRQHDGIAVEPRVKRTIEAHCKAGARILDAGCGEGSVTRFLASRYSDVAFYGVDVSPIGVSMASDGAPKNANFSISLLTKTKFENNFFDLIFSQSVIEHVEDWKGMLREMHRILKPGGTLMIRVENGGREEKHLFQALTDVVLGRNQVHAHEPSFELTPGDLKAHMSNFDVHEIPSEILERTMKQMGFSVALSTCQETLSNGSTGWKKIVLQFIGKRSSWPFKHAGYTTIAVGVKSTSTNPR